MFHVLVSGKRDYTDYKRFCSTMDTALQLMKYIHGEVEIVEGGAKGTDAMARRYAKDRGYLLKEFKADWKKHGRAAGPIRNAEMVEYMKGKTGRAIFFWDLKSRGTGDCYEKANKAGLNCRIFRIWEDL